MRLEGTSETVTTQLRTIEARAIFEISRVRNDVEVDSSGNVP